MYLAHSSNDSELMMESEMDVFTDRPSKDAFFFIRQYTLPVIGAFGIAGNVLSASIFFGPNHRNTSCSLYLAAKSITDSIFVLTLFIAWLDFVDIRVFHVDGVCQLTVFLSYVCSFLSVSLVVCVTVENYIRICQPTYVQTFCTTKIAKYIMSLLLFVAIILYNLPLWALRVQEFHGRRYCLTLNEYKSSEMTITYIDTFLTLVVPLVSIIILLFLIFCNSIEATKRNTRLRRVSMDGQVHFRPHSVVTRLLSSVSIMFLVLHTPSHVIRIKVIIESLIGNIPQATETDRHLHHIFLIMYYMNFSINCVIYIFCGKHFRHVFLNTFCKCCSRDRPCLLQEVPEDEEMFSQGFTMTDFMEKTSDDDAIGSGE